MRKLPTLIKRKPKPAPVPEVVVEPIAAEPTPVPVEVAPEPIAAPVEPEPSPVVVGEQSSMLTVPTYCPAPGYYRVVIALVDERGTVKHVDFPISAEAHASLIERSSWDQFFYPALLRLTQL